MASPEILKALASWRGLNAHLKAAERLLLQLAARVRMDYPRRHHCASADSVQGTGHDDSLGCSGENSHRQVTPRADLPAQDIPSAYDCRLCGDTKWE